MKHGVYICVAEFPTGVINKDSAAADDAKDTKDASNSVIRKLLIESMLKSVQSVLKNQEEDQQPGEYSVYSRSVTHYTGGSLVVFALIILSC